MNLIQIFDSLGIVKRGDFTLSSGIKSNTFVDMQVCAKTPWLAEQIIDALRVRMLNFGIFTKVFVPVPDGGMFWAEGLARKTPGAVMKTASRLAAGSSVVLVEDVITTGASVRRVREAISEHGATVSAVVTPVTRGRGINSLDVPVIAVKNVPV